MKLGSNHPLESRNELKTLENSLGGRKGLDFGTVRPRVQIPGPRPNPNTNRYGLMRLS
jgi:hypothetical protein